MIYRIFGRSGYGKSELIYNLMREKLEEHPERQFDIFLIVPEQETVNTERKIIDRFGNTANLRIEILNFPRLVSRVSRKVGQVVYDYADSTFKKLAMSKTLGFLEPMLEYYSTMSQNMEFIEQIAETVDRFKLELIAPTSLERAILDILGVRTMRDITEESIANVDGERQEILKKMRDISMIYSTYEKLMRESENLRDISDEMAYLCSLLDENYEDRSPDGTSVIKKFFNGTNVFIDSFDAFSNGQKQVISRIFDQADNVYITRKHLPNNVYEQSEEEENIFQKAAQTSDFIAELAASRNIEMSDIILKEPRRFKNEIIEFLEKNIWRDAKFDKFLATKQEFCGILRNALEIYECEKIFDEAETAAKKILYLVREKNYRYADIQIVVADVEDYRGVLDVVFEKYHIPLFMSVRTRLSTKPLMSMLLSLFDMIIYDFRLHHIHGYLKNGLCGLESDEIDELDMYITAWQISGISRYTGKGWNMHPEGYVEYDENDAHIGSLLENLNRIRQKFISPVNRFRQTLNNLTKQSENTVKNITIAIVAFLESIGAYSRLSELCEQQRSAGDLDEAAETVQVWNVLTELMQKIVLVRGDETVSLRQYADIFRFILDDIDIGKIPTSLDEVTVLNAELFRGGEKKCTIALGVNADIFPPKIIDGDLFNDREKAILKSVDLDFAQDCMRKSYDWLYYFYNAVTSSSECVILTYRNSQIGGEALLPSIAIDKIKVLFPDLKVYGQESLSESDMLLHLEGAENGAIAAAANATPDKLLNIALRNYFNISDSDISELKESTITIAPDLADKLFYNLSMSPGKLETYINCPFSYFCRYVLALRPQSRPKMQLHDIGRFIHRILELFMTRVRDEDADFKNITDEYIKSVSSQITDEYLGSVIKDYEFKSERFLYLLNRLKKIVFEIIKNLRDEFQTCDFIPADFELNINDRDPHGVPPVEIDIPGKGTLKITGIVDRVDILKEGNTVYIRIADYKTGSKKFNLSDILCGLNLQMFIYLFSVWRNGGGRYDDSNEPKSEISPAGIIYMPSRLDKYEKTPDMTEEDAIEEKNRKFTRSGLFLRDEKILRAMEHNLEGRYIPIKLKDGAAFENAKSTAAGVLASLEQIGKLERHITRTLSSVAKELSSGMAHVEPFKSTKIDSCRFCDMKRICRFEDGDMNKKNTQQFAPDKVWDILEDMNDYE